jgi:hypothetical protein
MTGVASLCQNLLAGRRRHRVARSVSTSRLRFTTLVVFAGLALVLLCAANASAAATLGLMFTGSDGAPTEGAEEWDAIGKSGAGYYRLPIDPGKTASGNDWTYYDKIFGLAAERGVTILPILQGRLNGGGGVPPNWEKAEWSAWAQKAVRRYGYKGVFWSTNPGLPARPVAGWELFNEPNNPSFGAISATEYGTFLAWAGPAVQSASESWGGQKTGVIFGGLLSWNGATNYQTYLKTAYNVPGASSAFTGLGFHPYTVEIADNNQKIAWTKIAIEGARSYLNSLGAGGKSIWITEFGWPVREQFAVTEGAQANMLLQTVGWMKAEASNLNLKAIIWYNARDSDFEVKWQYRCGLRDEVGNFRPSWYAFQQEASVARWPVPRTAIHQGPSGVTWTYSKSGGGINTLLGMAAGTSPSIGQFKGSYEVALQANTGTLFVWTPLGSGKDTKLAMAPKTSPTISNLEGGRIAFQGSNGNLWTYDSRTGSGFDTGWAMAPGTSPSISVLPELYWRKSTRYPIAFQGKSGNLMYTHGDGVLINTGIGMAPSTSPALTAQDQGAPEFVIHFQANTGALWIYEPGGTVASTGLGMKVKSSPAVASLPGGRYTGAFQANTGDLWLYNPGGTVASTGLGMQSESGPAVSAVGDFPYYAAYTIAFNANTGGLWTYEPGGAVGPTSLMSKSATSPSVAPG